jgi:release factor glutamine methyltransferase
MKVAEWKRAAVERLAVAGVEGAHLEAQLLAAHALGVDRTWLLAHPEAEMNVLAGEVLLQRRERREPLAYILGRREFYGRDFIVREGVLVPRQETEVLVDVALRFLDSRQLERPRVLDLGTGSGCIAVTLKLERPHADVTAIDISQKALDIAEQNAEQLRADVRLLLSHGFSEIEDQKFDLIVSNPPYIPTNEPLMPEVADYEPSEALYGGEDGLDMYRMLGHEAPAHLRIGGGLAVEVGAGQAQQVADVVRDEDLDLAEVVRDFSGIERVLLFLRK